MEEGLGPLMAVGLNEVRRRYLRRGDGRPRAWGGGRPSWWSCGGGLVEGFVVDSCIGEGKGDADNLEKFWSCGGINRDGGERR